MRSKTWNAAPNRYFERPQAVKSNKILNSYNSGMISGRERLREMRGHEDV